MKLTHTRKRVAFSFFLCFSLLLFGIGISHGAYRPSLLRLLLTEPANLESTLRPVIEGIVEDVDEGYGTAGSRIATVQVTASLTSRSLPEKVRIITFPDVDIFPVFKKGEEVLLFLAQAPPRWTKEITHEQKSLYTVYGGSFGKFTLHSLQGKRIKQIIGWAASAQAKAKKEARLAALKNCCMEILSFRDPFLTICVIEDMVSHRELASVVTREDSKAIRTRVQEAGKKAISIELLRLFVPLGLDSEEDVAFLQNISQSPAFLLSSGEPSPQAKAAARILERLNRDQQ